MNYHLNLVDRTSHYFICKGVTGKIFKKIVFIYPLSGISFYKLTLHKYILFILNTHTFMLPFPCNCWSPRCSVVQRPYNAPIFYFNRYAMTTSCGIQIMRCYLEIVCAASRPIKYIRSTACSVWILPGV